MMTLQQIADLVGASLCGIGDTRITGIETILAARSGDVTFAINATHLKNIETCAASAVLIPASLVESMHDRATDIALLICDDPELAFSTIAKRFKPEHPRKQFGISPLAFISDTASIHPTANIYPGAFIGDHVTVGANTTIFPGATVLDRSEIGADVTIFPNAVLYENTIVGDKCIIHANAVLGAWGFGYKSDSSGHRLSEQHGHVELAESVDIGACTTVDRATFGATRIGKGSKLDNQVMIGHNCQIGAHNLLCSQVGIAGSCSTGEFVVMAGQVGVADHVSINDHSVFCGKSGVMHELPGHQTYFGTPAMLAQEKLQSLRRRRRNCRKCVASFDEWKNDLRKCHSPSNEWKTPNTTPIHPIGRPRDRRDSCQ